MITRIFLLLLSACIVCVVSAQEVEANYQTICVYRLEYQPDSTDVNSKKTEDMLLLLSESSSLFKSKNRFLMDSALAIDEQSNRMGSMSFAMTHRTNFYFSIFKDTSNSIKTIDYVQDDKYLYTEPKNNFKWSVSTDTNTIAGLLCQKAVTYFSGRKWTAWFTPDIPIPDGPYKFNGLPGLIIRISDETDTYSFTLEQLINNPVIARFPKSIQAIKVSKPQFFAQLKYFIENRFEVLQLKGTTFTSGQEEFKKRFAELAKKNNNPIELKINE